jgi:hypothetical protein
MSHRFGLNRSCGLRGRGVAGLTLSLLIPALMGALLAQSRALAHHSFAATYLEDERITIEGTVLQFQFRNPHSFIHVQAPDENGEMQRWAVEWASPSQLTGQGVGQGTLRPGDIVQVTGAPGRDPDDHRMVLRRLFRPSDGYEYGRSFD